MSARSVIAQASDVVRAAGGGSLLHRREGGRTGGGGWAEQVCARLAERVSCGLWLAVMGLRLSTHAVYLLAKIRPFGSATPDLACNSTRSYFGGLCRRATASFQVSTRTHVCERVCDHLREMSSSLPNSFAWHARHGANWQPRLEGYAWSEEGGRAQCGCECSNSH